MNFFCYFAGRLTSKCDVYSFGVVLLELLTGRHAMDKTKGVKEQNLVEWARPYVYDRRKLFRIMDIRLAGQYSRKGAFQAAVLAIQCTSDPKHRPRMSEVLASLEKISIPRCTSSPSHMGQETVSSPLPKSPLGRNLSAPEMDLQQSPLQEHLKSPMN